MVRAACLVLLLIGPAAAAGPARVERFSPEGTVKQVRQVTARFSAPVVALGDPRAPAPFEPECPEQGSGRWIDPRTWAYDFERDLPGGVRCTFRTRDGLTTRAGEPITAASFTFSTGGPTIVRIIPGAKEQIAEDQNFVLGLDAVPDDASIAEHAWFAVAGLPERIPATVVQGEQRAAIVAALPEWQRQEPLVVLATPRRFPNDADVTFTWDAGIRAASGVETTVPQTVTWKTRPRFTADFGCERESATRGCIPLTPMRLTLSSPVTAADAARAVLVGPDDHRWTPTLSDGEGWVEEIVFRPPFPPDTTFHLELPPGLTDDAGRPLENAASFPLEVRTDAYPPLAKFAARFGIIEKADPTLPITVRSLGPAAGRQLRVGGRVARVPAADALHWLRRVAVASRTSSVFAGDRPATGTTAIKLPPVSGDHATEVIGLPLDGPGLYVVELASTRLGSTLLGKPATVFVPTAALVTNLSVHFEWGRESSLAWVTTLDGAKPVGGASVSIADCKGTAVAAATTDANGVARFGTLPTEDALPSCDLTWPEHFFDWRQVRALRGLDRGLLVMAEHDGDLGLVHSSWDDGIEPFRFGLPSEPWDGPTVAHTILDRALFRAGETVHMKHLLRQASLQGFAAVPPAERPTQLSIRHLGSDEHYEQPLAWNDDGSAESTWEIPRAAKLGRYDVVLVRPAAPGKPDWTASERTAGSFRVEEFRVPLMQGTIRLPREPLVAAKKVAADVAVRYLAGGAAARMPVTVRGEIRPSPLSAPPGLQSYDLASGPVREGVFHGDEDEFTFTKPRTLARQQLALDGAGTARARLVLLPRPATPSQLATEVEFRDPNGETQTVAATVPLWPGRWLPGVRADRWVLERGDLQAHAVVVDPTGTPVPGAPVRLDAFERRTSSTRKRVVGGFYAYDHTTEVRRVGEVCKGVTDAQGRFDCSGHPTIGGDLVLQASVTDPEGHSVATNTDVWVSRGEPWWFETGDADRIDIVPEGRHYEPGETARFQVRMPFREATALVTLEREGVMDARVVPLSGTAPVIELPVDAAWSPNVFVSVLVVRGRVGDVQPTAMIDLGRPAFKLGIAEIEVGWRSHTLDVSVTTDRAVYRPRDHAAATITVKTADGQAPPAGSQVAVAVVDEGLLELAPNSSWKVLDAMMGRRGYGVRTATATLEVVGKRHYGLKAIPGGGGGGRQPTRELFDTLLLWQGRVPLDASGEGHVEVPLNDSLTSFRIEAVATAGLGQFGSGGTSMRSTQDLMVLPGLPPLVREGDRFQAGVTVRNTTDRAMTVDLRATVVGLPAPLPPQTVSLAADAASVATWDVTVPPGASSLGWDIEVAEQGGATDHVRVTEQVAPAVPVTTLQATLLQWAPDAAPVPIQRPDDALAGRGGVAVGVSSSLTAGLGGVRDWMGSYPYTCMEQRVSRAVALGDQAIWREVMAALPAYQDGDGLVKFFPTQTVGSEVLTSYVLAISNAAGWALPDDARNAMLGGLRSFADGKLRRPSRLPDLSLRKLTALEALSRYGRAEPADLQSIEVELDEWPTSAVLDWWSLLGRMPDAPDRAARLAQAEQIVRARLDLSGTTLRFSSADRDGLWWLMTGPPVNAARLVLLLLDAGAWHDELPGVVRGTLGLQRSGHWDTTPANAWGALAVERFAHTFESAPVIGVTTVALGNERGTVTWAKTPAGDTIELPWPAGPGQLSIEHAGEGRPWAIVSSRAAVPLREPLASGFRITKHVDPVEPAEPGVLHRDDRLRVRLEIDAQSDMGWVVVDDPIPAGASHLAAGLASDETANADDQAQLEPAFVERSFASFRAYYDYVPKGRFVVEYVVRLNQPGTFQLPPTRVEALYAPETFGELPNAPLEVR
jgi:alpha-2-macroglobulin